LAKINRVVSEFLIINESTISGALEEDFLQIEKPLSAANKFHTGNASPGSLGKFIESLLPDFLSLIPLQPTLSK
jgi:hypothetical protein